MRTSDHLNALFFFKVYPTLSDTLQKEWDEAEQARYEDLITEQVRNSLLGYLKHLLPSWFQLKQSM